LYSLRQASRDFKANPVAREHFSREEKVLFPRASNLIGAERLQALGRRWTAARGVHLG